MEQLQLAHQLFVERARRRRLVEVEVAAEDLVGAFSGEHHLDAGRADAAGHEDHRRRGAHGRRVERLDVPDHVAESVQTLLHRELESVVDRADALGGALGRHQVGRARKPDRERVQTRPPGALAVPRLDPLPGEASGQRTDHGRVQPPESSTP
jgi:hypothetical protein